MNRRDFLSSMLKSAAEYISAGVLSEEISSQSLLGTGPSWIEIDGHPAGWAMVRGGDTLLWHLPADRGPRGILPPPSPPLQHVSNLELQFACGMSTGFYRWIGTCLQISQPAPATVDAVRFHAHDVVQRRNWAGAYVTHLVIPDLARDNLEPVRLQAVVHLAQSGDQHPAMEVSPVSQNLCTWSKSGFRFRIPGLERLSERVRGITALECTRPLATNVLDASGRNSVRAGAPVFSPLGLRLPHQEQERLIHELESRNGACRGILTLTSGGKPWLELELMGLRLASEKPAVAEPYLMCRIASARLRLPV